MTKGKKLRPVRKYVSSATERTAFPFYVQIRQSIKRTNSCEFRKTKADDYTRIISVTPLARHSKYSGLPLENVTMVGKIK